MENKRLVILKQSLEKKEAALDTRFAAHFDSVKAPCQCCPHKGNNGYVIVCNKKGKCQP